MNPVTFVTTAGPSMWVCGACNRNHIVKSLAEACCRCTRCPNRARSRKLCASCLLEERARSLNDALWPTAPYLGGPVYWGDVLYGTLDAAAEAWRDANPAEPPERTFRPCREVRPPSIDLAHLVSDRWAPKNDDEWEIDPIVAQVLDGVGEWLDERRPTFHQALDVWIEQQ